MYSKKAKKKTGSKNYTSVVGASLYSVINMWFCAVRGVPRKTAFL